MVTPHADVASGRYQQAEFAADLWQVHIGQGTAEYNDPKEFFRRTYLTESLKRLLVGAVRRVSGQGGDPVVQLQTNFGGGKTHSMLALYHLCSGTPVADLAGADAVMADAGAKSLTKVNRVVLVGNKISPGNPATKSDGTVVHTLWGELAWQLGGKKAFNRIAKDDEKATSPGDVLRELFVEYGPCLILIDEWVAYPLFERDEIQQCHPSFVELSRQTDIGIRSSLPTGGGADERDTPDAVSAQFVRVPAQQSDDGLAGHDLMSNDVTGAAILRTLPDFNAAGDHGSVRAGVHAPRRVLDR